MQSGPAPSQAAAWDDALAVELRARMAERVELAGETGWREAMLTVPRHRFAPETFWHGTERGFIPLHRGDEPDAWLRMAYLDRPMVVQVDHGAPAGLLAQRATSTLPSPSDIVAALSLLDVRPGSRVCEIGTGTGYTAALLAERTNPGNVTTVEIDTALAVQARRRLRAAGVGAVTVMAGDAVPRTGRFDRLLCTATVRQVPYAWLRLVRPGGLIVTNWGTPFHPGTLLRLTVRGDGTADGHLVPHTHHEWLRGHQVDAVLTVAEHQAAVSRASATTLGIQDIAGPDPDASIAIGLSVPDCASVFIPPDDQWFVDPATGSWARLHTGLRTNIVNQYGPRQLWDKIEAAYHWWRDYGRPAAHTWRITVTPDGTRAEPPLAVR